MKLGQFTPDEWFRAALALTGSRIAPIHQKIAIETARVAALTGHSDPADCCLMATARIKEVPLITHDPKIRAAAAKGYLQVIVT